jgi:hypothetical protein
MLRTALDVVDAQAIELLLEGRLSTPRRVLATLVRENLAGAAVRAHSLPQRLHHKRTLLMVRENVAEDVATVVVQKRHHVDTLVLAQQEREDVRHPQLVCARALEAPWRVLASRRRGLPLDHSLLVQYPPHLCLAHPQVTEARQHVADPSRPVLGMVPSLRHDGLALGHCRLVSPLRAATFPSPRHERGRSALLVLRQPRLDRRLAHLERHRDVGDRNAVLHHRLHYIHPHCKRVWLA